MPPHAATLELLTQRLPRLMAVYAFGSRVQGTATAGSDWDLAVLVEGQADPMLLWDTATFPTDFTRQDAAILNIQRAGEATLDMGQHLVRRERLGVPQSARDVFELLAQGGWIAAPLAEALKRMVGFRNVAVHGYQALQLPITVRVITEHLHGFLDCSQALLQRDGR